jgi:short chain dehydrogenase
MRDGGALGHQFAILQDRCRKLLHAVDSRDVFATQVGCLGVRAGKLFQLVGARRAARAAGKSQDVAALPVGGLRLVLKKLAAAIAAAGGSARFRALDVTSRQDTRAFADFVKAKCGRVDVLVNNAGVMPLSPLASPKLTNGIG